jgi:hypothetical protein
MPQKSWSAKRERQYTHIKDSLLERGKGEQVAAEIQAAFKYMSMCIDE